MIVNSRRIIYAFSAEVQSKEGRLRENIRLLSDRTRMLFDTQWTVQQLDGELLELLRASEDN
jgi:hypothetical protein